MNSRKKARFQEVALEIISAILIVSAILFVGNMDREDHAAKTNPSVYLQR